MAISNITSSAHVRQIFVEMNSMHKLVGMLQHVQSPKVLWAAAVMFYYLSCEREIEDRVFNGAFSLIQAYVTQSNFECRILALFILNNCLPCIERHQISEIIMDCIHNFSMAVQEHDYLMEMYQIIQNMSIFTNLHASLFEFEILQLLAQVLLSYIIT
jgi:hypothetical protein